VYVNVTVLTTTAVPKEPVTPAGPEGEPVPYSFESEDDEAPVAKAADPEEAEAADAAGAVERTTLLGMGDSGEEYGERDMAAEALPFTGRACW
jgi:hypothetical protein